MPVRKFKDVAEMEGNTWREPGDPHLFRAIRATWEFARRALPRHFPPGVHRHGSIEDAEKERERWEQANFEAHQARLSRRTSKASR